MFQSWGARILLYIYSHLSLRLTIHKTLYKKKPTFLASYPKVRSKMHQLTNIIILGLNVYQR